MIGQTISHYAPKACPPLRYGRWAHPPLADKILEKLRQKDGGQVGEVRPLDEARPHQNLPSLLWTARPNSFLSKG